MTPATPAMGAAESRGASPAGRGPTGAGSLGRLADLLGAVVSHLDAPSSGPPLHHVVAECNAVLEGCLEAQRDGRDREDRQTSSRDDLQRLAGLLAIADRADVVLVMRQIRRVLGRFDVCGA